MAPQPTRSHVLAVHGSVPPHRYSQAEITDAFVEVIAQGDLDERMLRRLHAHAGVEHRNLVLPLGEYADLSSFGQANDLFVEHAVEIGARTLEEALVSAGLRAADIDLLVCATTTGLAVPPLEGRIATRLGLRPDVRRVPLVGLGCVAGAAGLAQLDDYLVGHPGSIAALVTVELCSLTVQREDTSMANLVASSLFGDGAAAVVARGGGDTRAGDTRGGGARAGDTRGGEAAVEVRGSRSRLYPGTERTMAFDLGERGLQVALDAEVPDIVERHLGEDVDTFLADHDLGRDDIDWWVCHPGGPKVIDAVRDTLDLAEEDLALTRESLATDGNLSSASVLHVLADTLRDRPPGPGSHGVLMALGPGFCSQLVLLRGRPA